MASPFIARLAILTLIGVGAGTVHSYIRPVAVRPKAPPVTIPVTTPAPETPGGSAANPDSNPNANPNAAAPITPPAPQGLGLEISVAQAFDLYQQGRPFLDSRNLADYTKSHVEGAFWLPAEAFSGGKVPAALNYLDPSLEVVIYCSGGHCDASHNLAILLQQAGFARCHIMTDGLPGWVSAGHAVASGAPEGLE